MGCVERGQLPVELSGIGAGPILVHIFLNDFGTKSQNVLMEIADDIKLGDSVNAEEDGIN